MSSKRTRLERDKQEGITSRIASLTIPGESNDDVLNTVEAAAEVLPEYIEQMNNWVRVLDVRCIKGGQIAIPARYRWTIKRWAKNDMDGWMLDNGWSLEHHLKADSRQHRDNELEARYKKEINDWPVYTNIYVPFTEDVFEELSKGGHVKKARQKRDRKEKGRDIVMQKRLR